MGTLITFIFAVIGSISVTLGAAPLKCYNPNGKRIFLIAHGSDYGAYEYIDDDGVLGGFFHDVVREVCAAAGIDCRSVWDSGNCFNSGAGTHARGGKGLLDSWYDACTGWSVTVDRNKIFAFSESFIVGQKAAFYVKADNTNFDVNNFKDKTIGFIDGWASDEKCVARTTNTVLAKSYVKHYPHVKEFVDAIVNGEVDAGYAADHYLVKYTTGENPKLKMVGGTRNCVLSGNAMMARKDNYEFLAKWNEGFSKIVSNGKFKKMCDLAQTVHTKNGGKIECV